MCIEPFVFPDDLDNLTMTRMNLPDVPEDWTTEGQCFTGRVSNIIFRKPGQMTFFLDGRKSGTCNLTPHETGWLDAGIVTPVQVACRFAASRYTRFSRNPIQKKLFD